MVETVSGRGQPVDHRTPFLPRPAGAEETFDDAEFGAVDMCHGRKASPQLAPLSSRPRSRPGNRLPSCGNHYIRADMIEALPTRRRAIRWFAGVLTLALPAAAAQAQARPPLTVFAAASLTDALNAVGRVWTARTGQPVRFSFAASGTIARQIEAGARADLFVSADRDWMDRLEQAGRLVTSARRDLLGGRLVLIAPIRSSTRLPIRPGFPLAAALGPGRLAIGEPRAVPAGRYAQEALTRLGVWDQVSARLAPAPDVRAALAYVARGEAPLGIVYESDAAAERGVRLVGVFPPASHSPIVYPAAVVKGAGAGAAGFYKFLGGAEAKAIFRRYRFRPL
jgi:molybdate transport system substrate-binding protein